MFLDDTACNLASLNVLTFFDSEARRFDVEGFKHGCRIWTIVLEISVLMASFPSESIARLSYQYRTLGLGYANLGAMLMQAGIPYDSEKGRAICAAISAILTGESYAASAEMARELGAFPMYECQPLGHAAGDPQPSPGGLRRSRPMPPLSAAIGDYENLDIAPVGIDAAQFADSDPMAPRSLLIAARECWDRALTLGERHGYPQRPNHRHRPHRNHRPADGLRHHRRRTGLRPGEVQEAGRRRILQDRQPIPRARPWSTSAMSRRRSMKSCNTSWARSRCMVRRIIEYNHLKNLGFTDAELDKIEASPARRV